MSEHFTPAKTALRGHAAIISGQFHGVIEPIRQLVNAVRKMESQLMRAQPMPSGPPKRAIEMGNFLGNKALKLPRCLISE
jgi:hypothetical protein